HAAQRRHVDTAAEFLRPDVADEMSGAVSVAVRMAIEAGNAEARFFAAPVIGEVELLLRKLAHEQAKTFELLRIQDAVEELEEILRRHELPLRHVAELRTRRQVDRRREFREEVLRNIELHVESIQVALLLREHPLNVRFGKDHSP